MSSATSSRKPPRSRPRSPASAGAATSSSRLARRERSSSSPEAYCAASPERSSSWRTTSTAGAEPASARSPSRSAKNSSSAARARGVSASGRRRAASGSDDLPRRRGGLDVLHRHLPDPARRHVDRAPERQHVVRHHQQAQVREGVAHLLALPEAGARHHRVGDRPAHQLRLEAARLGVDAEQHRHLAERGHGAQALDLVGHEARLVALVGRQVHAHRLAVPDLRREPLGAAARVVGDHRRGRLQDRLGRPVVAPERHHPAPRVGCLEVEDVLDLGAPPAVDRLVLVPHRGQVRRLAAQQPHQSRLGEVGVLVLVHQDPAETGGKPLAQRLFALEQRDGAQQHVVEVHRSGRAQLGFVRLVQLGEQALVARRARGASVLGATSAFLAAEMRERAARGDRRGPRGHRAS